MVHTYNIFVSLMIFHKQNAGILYTLLQALNRMDRGQRATGI